MQERSHHGEVLFCNGRFSQLVARCSNPFAHVIDIRSGFSSFGQDPSFNPSSGLFNADAAENAAEYYNVSQGSHEMSVLGNPYGFFPWEHKSKEAPFVVVLPVRTGTTAAIATL